FDDVAPYAGIGFDFGLFGKVGLNLDLGVLFQGAPAVALSADGLLANDPDFQASLAAEQAELEDEVDDYKAYPVASLTLTFQCLWAAGSCARPRRRAAGNTPARAKARPARGTGRCAPAGRRGAGTPRGNAVQDRAASPARCPGRVRGRPRAASARAR